MSCRSCSGKVTSFIDFGKLPLGNAFLKPADFKKERLYGLELGFCNSCKLVQQVSPPPVESLESDYQNYSYVPFGSTLDSHYKGLARTLVEGLHVGPTSFVLDIGSNNGLLLNYMRNESKCRVLGVEPAVKISQMARDSGVPTVTEFFTADVAATVRSTYGGANVVTVTQVLQHIPAIGEFMGDVRRVMAPGATLVVEGRYFADTVRKRSYDTVYHEMMYFFTLLSLGNLCRRHGLEIYKAETTDIYGGSLRIYAKVSPSEVDESVFSVIKEEDSSGLAHIDAYEDFASETFKLSKELRSTVRRYRKEGKTIAGYGAPSTSATLLNFAGLGPKEISYIIDDSPLKQGQYTPGNHIAIVDSKILLMDPPDMMILLAWRLKDEILEKLKPYRERGMKVLVPLPKVETI